MLVKICGITRADDALAAALFDIEHVTDVFYVDHWITVTQDGQADWQELMRKLAVPIREAPAADEQTAAWAALGKAEAVSTGKPDVERDLIDALAKRYAPEPVADRAPFDHAYAEALGLDAGETWEVLRGGAAASFMLDDRGAR